jgi:hypothetical protein
MTNKDQTAALIVDQLETCFITEPKRRRAHKVFAINFFEAIQNPAKQSAPCAGGPRGNATP